jgi:uncharacterized membrane protein YfcA
MNRTDSTISSAVSLFSSLLFYLYARERKIDTGPYVMVGAFVGSLVGDIIVDSLKQQKNECPNI